MTIEELTQEEEQPDFHAAWRLFGIISERELNFDAEKGFVDIEIIFRRKSDGLYFKTTYTQFGHNGNNLLEQKAIRVYPKEVTTTIYEEKP